MKNKEYQSITKMIEYIERVELYTGGMNFEEFSRDIKTVDATVLVISQIGELVKNFDKDFQQQYNTIKWHILKGVRNRIVHDYEGINLRVVWSIITNDLQPLKDELQKIVDNRSSILNKAQRMQNGRQILNTVIFIIIFQKYLFPIYIFYIRFFLLQIPNVF